MLAVAVSIHSEDDKHVLLATVTGWLNAVEGEFHRRKRNGKYASISEPSCQTCTVANIVSDALSTQCLGHLMMHLEAPRVWWNISTRVLSKFSAIFA